MGCMSLAIGLIIDRVCRPAGARALNLQGTDNGAPGTSTPALASLIVLEVLAAIFCEMANGSNFSLVPVRRPHLWTALISRSTGVYPSAVASAADVAAT